MFQTTNQSDIKANRANFGYPSSRQKHATDRESCAYIYTHNMNWDQKRTTKTRAKIISKRLYNPQENTEKDVQGGHHYLDDFLSSQT